MGPCPAVRNDLVERATPPRVGGSALCAPPWNCRPLRDQGVGAQAEFETGNVDEARRTLQGRHAEETAAALLLSVTSVRNALDGVRPELRRTIDTEKGRATRSVAAKRSSW